MWRGTLHSWSIAKVLPTAASAPNFSSWQNKIAQKYLCRTGGIKKTCIRRSQIGGALLRGWGEAREELRDCAMQQQRDCSVRGA